MNGFGPVGGVDESHIVKEAVLFLQRKQVRLRTGCFGRHGAGQDNVQVADRRLRRLTSSGLSFMEKRSHILTKTAAIISNRFRILSPLEADQS